MSIASVPRRRGGAGLMPGWPLVVLACLMAVAAAAYVALPLVEARREAARVAEPAAPLEPVRATINGVTLTIPRDLVRFEHQKRDAEQARIDLLFRWPSLEGAGPRARLAAEGLDQLVFLSIQPRDEALDPTRRLAAVYHRFLETEIRQAPIGLAARRFAAGSGYDGEELVYDAARPGDFFVRCAPAMAGGVATCMRELRIADSLDVVVRFPRALLDDWSRLERAITALLLAIGASRS
jgi:hypothetical protein